MYDDSSYYTFVPSNQETEHKSRKTDHKRRKSLLTRPEEIAHADAALTDDEHGTGHRPSKVALQGPPKAISVRRAQSYRDFRWAVQATCGTEHRKPRRRASQASLKDEIKNEEQFLGWYHGIEQGLLEVGNEEYIGYERKLALAQSHLESILAETDTSLNLLSTLAESFTAVETQTGAFEKQCESVSKEQAQMTKVVTDIEENLKYYSFLEPATKRLNAPTVGAMVKSQEFSDLLSKLDECLEYMTSHSTHREANTYRSRYRLLLTRGLTLIRNAFVNGVRDIATDVSRRIADKQLNETTMSTLLYAKFRVGATKLKELATEIRKRSILSAGASADSPNEYQSLMDELYVSYSATRGRLVIPLTRKKIEDIAVSPRTATDLVKFARSGIGYVCGVCSDEESLWREWFEGEDHLYEFLESICEPLYDQLRRRIIHENQLLRLCELCTMIQNRYMHDSEDEGSPVDVVGKELDFSVLIQPALEDAQTRLVFLAQGIVRDDIERYKPTPDVLEYPSRNKTVSLSGTKSNNHPPTSGRKASVVEPTTPMPKTPVIVEEANSPFDNGWSFDTEAAFEGWYPTLRKAIWLLSRIYKLVNSVVFDDLAHHIVHSTTVSLANASTLISHRTSSPPDGHLFLIKHLLILKQQIVAFDIEYVHPDTSLDFSGVTATFHELRDRGGLFDLRNLWRFLSSGGSLLPKVVENMLDAKVELDGRLRTVINEFVAYYANRMTAPILTFTPTDDSGKKNSQSAKTKALTPADNPIVAVQATQKSITAEIPLLRPKLAEYLSDARTSETLVMAVQDHVLQTYESFYERVVQAGGGKVKSAGSKKGKGKEGEVWDVDMFGEWCEGVFEIRKLGLGIDAGSDIGDIGEVSD